MATPTALRVAPTEKGCVIQIEGRGTMKQSPAPRAVALETLHGDEHAVVVVDLSECEFLDSTFLGFFAEMFARFGKAKRFFVAGPAEKRHALLHPARLDTLLPSMDQAPDPRGAWIPISISPLQPRDLSKHVIECHRSLAQASTPMSGTFARIADHLERELAAGG
jgi:anti-anti-sigma regulatory factor